MRRCFILFFILSFFIAIPSTSAKTINEADTEVCETLKYALIRSLDKPIDRAIQEIYKNDKNAPPHLTNDTVMTEIVKIKQIHGVGGLYHITMRIYPFYGAHNTYGVDEIVVTPGGHLISYKHIKTYP